MSNFAQTAPSHVPRLSSSDLGTLLLRPILRLHMQSHRPVLLAASVFWTLTTPVAAQELAVLGQGNISCGSWLESRKSGDAQVSARIAWILGYITAFSQYGSKPPGDVSGGKGTEEMAAWIDDYCRQHPADNVYKATAALVNEFKEQTGR